MYLIELEREFITGLEIKNEDLIQGLKVLSTEIMLEHFEEKSVIKFLNNSPKINASKTRSEDVVPLSNPTLSKFTHARSITAFKILSFFTFLRYFG